MRKRYEVVTLTEPYGEIATADSFNTLPEAYDFYEALQEENGDMAVDLNEVYEDGTVIRTVMSTYE